MINYKALFLHKLNLSPPGERRVYWNISSPVKGFRAIQKPLYSPPLLTSIFLPTNIFSISLHQTLHLFTQVSIPKRERVWAPLPDVVLESLGRRLCRMCLKYPPLCYCRSELSKNFTFGPILLCLPASLLSPLFKLFPQDPVCWFRIAYSVASKNLIFTPPPSYRSWCCLPWE